MSERATLDSLILERAERVRERIGAACRRAERDPSSVTLIGVVKTFGPEVVRAARAAGLLHLGESYAQDLRDKARAVADLSDIHWHFVGKIQTNKVKYLVGTARTIHAVDRLEVAEAVSGRVERMGVEPPRILVSVNLGEEESKSGVPQRDLHELWDAVGRLPGIRPAGLMCLPPWSDDPESSRPFFRRLRELGESLRGKMRVPGLFHLSMGMSHDLEVAIEEGATHVRVGTDLFGERRH